MEGIWGLRYLSCDKITKIEGELEPKNFGNVALSFCKKNTLQKLLYIYNNIKIVSDEIATEKDIDIIKLFIKSAKGNTYSSLLEDIRENNNIGLYADGLSYMIDDKEFIKDSMLCEWGYIINLDSNQFEIWKGNQYTQQWGNRYNYRRKNDDAWFACKLLISYSLYELPKNLNNVSEVFSIERNIIGDINYNGRKRRDQRQNIRTYENLSKSKSHIQRKEP